MICYVFKCRAVTYTSKKDSKTKRGWNVGLLTLEGSKFHLETFVDQADNVFKNSEKSANLSQVFGVGFWDIDIDEFEVVAAEGTFYKKKIAAVLAAVPANRAKELMP